MARRGVSAVTPIRHGQIDAAAELFGRLIIWGATNEVLLGLAEKHPGSSVADVSIKAKAVNNFYGTHVAAYKMESLVEQISAALESPGGVADEEDVERMGTFRNPDTGEAVSRHFSFASKYAHFFIDRKRFFILDSLGQEVVKRHGAGRIREFEGRYVDFVHWVRRLTEGLPEEDQTPERVDYFYWLRGMFDRDGELKDEINLEARLVLGSGDPEVRRLVGELLGGG